MCSKCVTALTTYFPNATPEERDRILWEETPWPAGSAEDIEKAIKNHYLSTSPKATP